MGKHVGKGLARQLFAFVIIILCSLFSDPCVHSYNCICKKKCP